MKKKSNNSDLSKILKISRARSTEALIKAQLISAVLDHMQKQSITHLEVADKSGLPRSAVTGILSGSLQKVTIDRILRLVDAVGLHADIKIIKVA